jgi:hypothetical protein
LGRRGDINVLEIYLGKIFHRVGIYLLENHAMIRKQGRTNHERIQLSNGQRKRG